MLTSTSGYTLHLASEVPSRPTASILPRGTACNQPALLRIPWIAQGKVGNSSQVAWEMKHMVDDDDDDDEDDVHD